MTCERDDRGWLDGQLERFHPEGGIAERSTWADDQPHGIMERFHVGGELAQRIPWVRGVIDGVVVWAYASEERPELAGGETPRRVEVRYRDGAPVDVSAPVVEAIAACAAADDEPGDEPDEPDDDDEDEPPRPTEPPLDLQAHLAAVAVLATTDEVLGEQLAILRKIVGRGLDLAGSAADRERGLDDRAVEWLRARPGAPLQAAMIAAVRHGTTRARFDSRRQLWLEPLLAPIVRIGGAPAADLLVELWQHDPTFEAAVTGLARLGDDRADAIVVQLAEACLAEPWLYDGMACHARFFAAMDAARDRQHPRRAELVRRALGGAQHPWPWTWTRWALEELIASPDAAAAADLEAAFHRWVDVPGDRWTARTDGLLLAGLAGCALAACDPPRAKDLLAARWAALEASGRRWDRTGSTDAQADRDAYAYAVLVGGLVAIAPHHDGYRACVRYQLAYRGTGRLAARDPITSFSRSTLAQEHLMPVRLALTGLELGAAAAATDSVRAAEAIAWALPWLACAVGRSYERDLPYQHLRDQARRVIVALGGTPRPVRVVTPAGAGELATQGRAALLAALTDPTVAGKHHLIPELDGFADADTTATLGAALIAETPYTDAYEDLPVVDALVASLARRRPDATPYLASLRDNPHAARSLRQAAGAALAAPIRA